VKLITDFTLSGDAVIPAEALYRLTQVEPNWKLIPALVIGSNWFAANPSQVGGNVLLRVDAMEGNVALG